MLPSSGHGMVGFSFGDNHNKAAHNVWPNKRHFNWLGVRDSGLSCLTPENCEGRIHSRSHGFLKAFLEQSLLPDSHWMGSWKSTGIWRLESRECDLGYKATVSLGRGPF